MTKEFLNNMEYLYKELENLQKRIDKIEKKETTTVKDSVQASSRSYPYTKYNCKIEGIKVPRNRGLKNKYKKMIKSKQYKLDKLKLQLEYELNYVENSEIRDIIRYKYNDNMTWLQVMFEMGYSSESAAKMALKRFFEKNKKCDKCDEEK